MASLNKTNFTFTVFSSTHTFEDREASSLPEVAVNVPTARIVCTATVTTDVTCVEDGHLVNTVVGCLLDTSST